MSAGGDALQPIIVRRVKKVAGGHHGGAWKVAYADFVTAMMAFFLVMWLVGAGTKEQKAAISEYFKNPSAFEGKNVTPAPGPLGAGGASNQIIRVTGSEDLPRGPGQSIAQAKPMSEEDAKKASREVEKRQFEELKKQIETAIAASQAMAPFKDQLLLDITPEGLRIQIVDQQNRPMFNMGSSQLMPYTQAILTELVQSLSALPNRISLTGHTDITPYQGGAPRYSNWELSADRANAARRALEQAGLEDAKVARVVGLGSSVLFDKLHPDSPINRRISLVVMNQAAEDAAVDARFGPDPDQASRQAPPGDGAATPLPPATTPVPAIAAAPAPASARLATPVARSTPAAAPAAGRPVLSPGDLR